MIKNGKFGFIDVQGKTILPFIYDYASNFSDGLSLIMDKGRYFFINKKGDIQKELEFDRVDELSCGLARVEKNNKIGFIDTTGKIVIPIIYDAGSSFSKKLQLTNLKAGGKWYKINTKGEVLAVFE